MEILSMDSLSSIPLSKILPWFHYHRQSHTWTPIVSLPWYMFLINPHVPDINSGKPHRAQSSNKELLYTLTHCVLLFIICPIISLSVFWSILESILALGWWGIITLLYVGQEYTFFTPCTSRFPHRICLSFRAVNFHFHCPQKVETFETFCYKVDSYLAKRHTLSLWCTTYESGSRLPTLLSCAEWDIPSAPRQYLEPVWIIMWWFRRNILSSTSENL